MRMITFLIGQILMLGCTNSESSAEKVGIADFVDAGTSWEDVIEKKLFRVDKTRAIPLADITVPHGKKVVLLYRDPAASDEDRPIDLSPLDRFESDELLVLIIPSSIISPEEASHLTRHKSLEYLGLTPLCTVSDETIASLSKLTWLKALDIPETDITEKGLRNISKMKKLEKIDLYGTDTTNTGLEHVKVLSELRILNLGRTKITDEGLKHISKLNSLESLDLHDTQITDAGLKHLQKLRNLEALNLEHTKITEAGLMALAELPTLRKINLSPDQVPEEHLEKFREAAPKVEILIPKVPPPV